MRRPLIGRALKSLSCPGDAVDAFIRADVLIEGSVCLVPSRHYALPGGLLMTSTMGDAALVIEVLLLIAILATTSSPSPPRALFVFFCFFR